MTKPDDLIAYLFDGQQHLLSALLREWLEASARFTTFGEIYRDKIRKKIRLARDPESVLDLRGELETAYCLLNDRRLTLAYEPYASAKRRGPDFAVTYRANQVFNLEVTRLRVEEPRTTAGSAVDLPRQEERLLRTLGYKLGQMRPGVPNLLVIHPPAELAQSIDLERLMQALKARADGKDPAFYAAARYPNPAAFYKDFLHLSAILLWAAKAPHWVNKQARPPLPENILRLVAALDAASPHNL